MPSPGSIVRLKGDREDQMGDLAIIVTVTPSGEGDKAITLMPHAPRHLTPDDIAELLYEPE